MHDSALEFGRLFLETYGRGREGLSIGEIGASDVNGSLRRIVPETQHYVGFDIDEGPGVDKLMEDPYRIPLEDSALDMCLASSCFEHVEFFWLLFEEMLRVVKPDGLVYLDMPSTGPFHRFPVDCWRFYPDSGVALEKWGRRAGHDCLMLESSPTPAPPKASAISSASSSATAPAPAPIRAASATISANTATACATTAGPSNGPETLLKAPICGTPSSRRSWRR